ncbi:MAG: DUF4358 domain-containing protein [Lachnospiraceae bacterium]|nr:DUF4358 domain-containing protein [Lachnospiraceae bacterium]
MKKAIVCLCTGMLVLSMVACGRNDEGQMQESQNPTESSQQNNDTATATPESTEAPQGENGTSELKNIRQTLVEVLGENYWPNTEISAEYLEDYGLSADMYEDFYGEMPMISTNVDTVIVVQAKEGQVVAVEEVMNKYRDNLVNDTMQYPMNVGKIQASRIETFGNYVCFVQLGADTTQIYGEDGDEEAVIKHCQEQNELAIEAIGKALGK